MTLGTTEVHADHDAPVAADLVAQPKRLALLAFLAIDRPGAQHFRDSLVALLWPEFDAARARHALRQTLYHLRRSLGPSLIVADDHATVGIRPDALWCDAVAFQEAIGRGQLSCALGLYGGPFMPGFHSDCGPDYDLWLDTVHQRLHRQAVQAAWALTDRAEANGDGREACAWARRTVALQPGHERATLRLARLLGTSGQRIEALRTLDTLVTRLVAEGLVPSPQVLALAASVRSGRLDELTPHYRGQFDRSDTRPTLADCNLAVLPLTPLSESPAEITFANGMTEMLTTDLARAGCTSLLSRTSVLASLDSDLPLPEIARALGVDFVLEGTVAIEAETVRVTVQLLSAAPERHLWAGCFERQLENPLLLQTDIAAAAADAAIAALRDQVTSAAAAPVPPTHP